MSDKSEAMQAVLSEMRKKTPKAPLYMWPYFILRFIVLFGALTFLCFTSFVLMLLFIWFPAGRFFDKMKTWGSGTIFSFEVWLIEKLAGIHIDYYGDKIPMNESALCISNHIMGTDYLTFFPLAYRKGLIGQVRFFAKELVRYIPFIGWGLSFTGTIFIKRNFEKDEKIMAESLGLIAKNRSPCYLVSFLEGTRSTPEKLLESHKYAKEHGLAEWENTRHVILPRYKGFMATARYLAKHAPHVRYVYDFTIMYPDDLVSGWMVFNQFVGRRIAVYIKKYELTSLPLQDTGAIKQWVFDRFLDKERMLTEVEKGGRPWTFPKQVLEQKQDEPMELADWCYYSWKKADEYYDVEDKAQEEKKKE